MFPAIFAPGPYDVYFKRQSAPVRLILVSYIALMDGGIHHLVLDGGGIINWSNVNMMIPVKEKDGKEEAGR